MNKDTFLKEYYNMDNTVFDVKRKLGLNNRQYSKLYHKYNLNKRVRHMNYNNAKYTCKLKNGRITIRKWIGKNKEYLGVYKSQEDADGVVEVCKQHNWDLENNIVQDTINQYRIKPKHYTRINGRYYVYKRFNGKKVYYDSFLCEQDAIDCVNLLNKIDWNKNVYEEMKVLA